MVLRRPERFTLWEFSLSHPKCEHCGKTVYHAEEQLYDGMLFHAGCFTKWNKIQKEIELGMNNCVFFRNS